jgi:hypothetical protein
LKVWRLITESWWFKLSSRFRFKLCLQDLGLLWRKFKLSIGKSSLKCETKYLYHLFLLDIPISLLLDRKWGFFTLRRGYIWEHASNGDTQLQLTLMTDYLMTYSTCQSWKGSLYSVRTFLKSKVSSLNFKIWLIFNCGIVRVWKSFRMCISLGVWSS